MPNVIEILVTGKNLTKPAFDEAARNARAIGQQTGDEFTKGVGDKVKKDLPAEVEKPLTDSGKKGGESGGAAAGEGFLSKASPLMLGAFTAAAAVGPGAILGATALAVVGAGALITKGNAQLQESYAQLGERASDAIQQAAAPLIPELYASVGVLEQGVAKVGPELKSVFSAVAPDVTALTGGLVSLVSNTLPGLASGLRAIAPYAQDLAVDFGKLGSGLGGFFGALGAGAGGGMAGFSALTDVVSALLPDLGKIVGSLSNGLGPALHDVANVAIPVAGALAAVVAAIPPPVIEAAAVATGTLFAAFKIGTLLGIVTEGKTFLEFLGATITEERAATLAANEAAASTKGLGAASSIATGPIGLLTIATVGLYSAISSTDKGTAGWAGTVVKAAQAAKDHADAVAASTQAMTAQVNVTDDLTVALNSAHSASIASAQQSAVTTLASLGLTKGISSLTDGLYTSLTAYSAVTAAAGGYNSILQALDGTTASLDDAQNSMAQDLLNLKTSFKANGDSLNLNTQAGISNRESLSAAAKAANDLATAQYQATGDMGKANQTLQQQENQILANTGATGKARDAIKAYLDQILHIPPDVTTNVYANTGGAVSAVKNVIKWIDGQSASFYVNTTGPGARAAQAGFAHGGIVGAAASGGIRSNLTAVGEHGIELLDLAPGTRVHSNPDSMRMLAAAGSGGGGWDGVVRLEVTGDDLMAQWIRNHVRVVAGNAPDSVQRAFGQNF